MIQTLQVAYICGIDKSEKDGENSTCALNMYKLNASDAQNIYIKKTLLFFQVYSTL